MKAIACMSANRVIGKNGRIPWNIPEELEFFKLMTIGRNIVIGKTTRDGLPKLRGYPFLDVVNLPNRKIYTLSSKTKNYKCSGINIDDKYVENYILDISEAPNDSWICGGAQIYKQFLPRCSDFFLSVLKDEYEGDVEMPAFEHLFYLKDISKFENSFEVRHYKRKTD